MMEASNPGQPTCTTSLSTSIITALSTSASSTSSTSTSAPFTSASSTSVPFTSASSTSAPFTSASSTSAPFTSASSTSAPFTSASSTSAPFTSASSTSAPFTSASTSAPFTSASSTSASSTLVSSTSTSPTSSSVVNHLPSTLDTMPIGQHSLTSPPVFSASGCTASPFFHAQLSSSTPLLPSTLSGQPATLLPQAPSISSLPMEAMPSSLQQISPSLSLSHPTYSQPSTLLSGITCAQSSSSFSYHQVPPASSSLVIDPETLSIHAKYALPGQSCIDWLNSLSIPRNVDSLEQVKEIWELGGPHCTPLRDWTVMMRNFKSTKGRNTSLYSQRKFIYLLFKRHEFNVSMIYSQYNEVKPGKLYKHLNTSKKTVKLLTNCNFHH